MRGSEQALEDVLYRYRLASLALGATRLPGGGDQASDEREDHQRGRRRGDAVAAQELPGPIGWCVAARGDGLPLEMAADVVGQGLRGRIAPLGLLLKGLEDDAVEVAAQPAPQVAPFGPRALDGRAVARPHRLLVEDRLLELPRPAPG